MGSYPTVSPLPLDAAWPKLGFARGGLLSAALSVQPALEPTVPRFHEARYPVVSGLSSSIPPKWNTRDRPGSGPGLCVKFGKNAMGSILSPIASDRQFVWHQFKRGHRFFGVRQEIAAFGSAEQSVFANLRRCAELWRSRGYDGRGRRGLRAKMPSRPSPLLNVSRTHGSDSVWHRAIPRDCSRHHKAVITHRMNAKGVP